MTLLNMKSVVIFALLLMTMAATGCNTMEGLGEDVKTLGESIEKKAGGSSGSSSDY